MSNTSKCFYTRLFYTGAFIDTVFKIIHNHPLISTTIKKFIMLSKHRIKFIVFPLYCLMLLIPSLIISGDGFVKALYPLIFLLFCCIIIALFFGSAYLFTASALSFSIMRLFMVLPQMLPYG